MNFAKLIPSPMIQKWLAAAIRHGLTALGAYLLANGMMKDDASAKAFVESMTPILAALLWSAYEKFSAREKLVTSMATPAVTSEHQLEQIIAGTDKRPPVGMRKSTTPYPVGQQRGPFVD